MSVAPELLGIVAADPAALVRKRHIARDLTLFPRISARAVVGGGHFSRFRGRGMDFDEVRPYQAGDDVRNIDWRVTARTNTTHTKIFREERERPVLVVTDLRSTMFFGSNCLKSVVACEVAAILAWAGLNANDRVGGLVFGPQQQQEIRTRRSHHSVLQYIQVLSTISASLLAGDDDSLSLADLLRDVRRVAHPGTTVILVSDFHDLDEDCERHLFELARHADLTLCQIYDELESHLPPPGLYPVNDGDTRFLLNTRSIQVRQQFEQRFSRQRHKLRQLASRLRLGLLQFSTADAVVPVLLRAYGKASRSRTRSGAGRQLNPSGARRL